jgi:hypothetical protein
LPLYSLEMTQRWRILLVSNPFSWWGIWCLGGCAVWLGSFYSTFRRNLWLRLRGCVSVDWLMTHNVKAVHSKKRVEETTQPHGAKAQQIRLLRDHWWKFQLAAFV